MSYTLSEVKKMIMDIVGENSDSPTYWTSANDSELEEWIADAIEEVCIHAGLVTAEIQIPMWGGREIYYLDPGKGGEFLWIKNIRIFPSGLNLEQTSVEKESRNDYNWITRTGTTEKFIQLGTDAIRVVPVPSSSGDMLEATVVIIPPFIENDEEPLRIPDPFIGGIVNYAVSTYFLSVRKLEDAAKFFQEYAKLLSLVDTASGKLIPKTPNLRAGAP